MPSAHIVFNYFTQTLKTFITQSVQKLLLKLGDILENGALIQKLNLYNTQREPNGDDLKYTFCALYPVP